MVKTNYELDISLVLKKNLGVFDDHSIHERVRNDIIDVVQNYPEGDDFMLLVNPFMDIKIQEIHLSDQKNYMNPVLKEIVDLYVNH